MLANPFDPDKGKLFHGCDERMEESVEPGYFSAVQYNRVE